LGAGDIGELPFKIAKSLECYSSSQAHETPAERFDVKI